MRKLSVLLVDDNPQFLKTARDLVAGLPCVAGVECASSGAEALAQASQSRPDLVLTDIFMPGMSGFEVIRTLHAHENPPRIVALTLHESTEYRAAVKRSGADDLVPKREFSALIPQMIASLAATSDGDEFAQHRAQPGASVSAGNRDRRRQNVAAIAPDRAAPAGRTIGRDLALHAENVRCDPGELLDAGAGGVGLAFHSQ